MGTVLSMGSWAVDMSNIRGLIHIMGSLFAQRRQRSSFQRKGVASKLAPGACLFARWQIILAASMGTTQVISPYYCEKEKVRATLLRHMAEWLMQAANRWHFVAE
jgi:hypothetical protein